MKSRSRTLADKSIDAMLAAIEVYNKPTFAYREESFAILAINSWELLLKARLLKLANNRLAVILSYEHRQRADGTHSEKLYRKRAGLGRTCPSDSFGRSIDSVTTSVIPLIHRYAKTLSFCARSVTTRFISSTRASISRSLFRNSKQPAFETISVSSTDGSRSICLHTTSF